MVVRSIKLLTTKLCFLLAFLRRIDNMAERKTKAIFSEKEQKKAYDAMLEGKISFDEYLGISMQANDEWAEQAVRRVDAASDIICSIIDMDTEKNIMRQDMIKKVKNILNSMIQTKGNDKEVELGKKLLKLYNKILSGKYHQEEDSADTIAGKIFGPSEKEIEERRKLEAVLEYIIENVNNIDVEEENIMGRLVKSDIYRLFEGTQTGAAKKLQKLMEEDEKKKDAGKKNILDKLSDFAKDPFGKKDDDTPIKSVFDKFFTDEEEEKDKEDPLLDYDNGKLIIGYLKKVYQDPDTSEKDKKIIKICLEFYQDYTKEDISSYKKKDIQKMVEILMDSLEEAKKEEKSKKKNKIDLDFLNPKDSKKNSKKKSILDLFDDEEEKKTDRQDKKIDKKINLLEEGVKTLINTFAAFEKRLDEKEKKQSQQSQNPSSNNKKNLAFDWIRSFRYEDVGGNKNDFYKVLGRLNKLSEELIKTAGRIPAQGSFHLVKKSYKNPENFCVASVDGKKIFWLFGKDNCNLYNESEFHQLKEDLRNYEAAATKKKTSIDDIFEDEEEPEKKQEQQEQQQ